MQDVEKRFRKIVAEVFNVDPKKLKGTTTFVDDLKAKSMNMIELIAAVEMEFGIEAPARETNKNKTIAQAVKYIEKKLKEKK